MTDPGSTPRPGPQSPASGAPQEGIALDTGPSNPEKPRCQAFFSGDFAIEPPAPSANAPKAWVLIGVFLGTLSLLVLWEWMRS